MEFDLRNWSLILHHQNVRLKGLVAVTSNAADTSSADHQRYVDFKSNNIVKWLATNSLLDCEFHKISLIGNLNPTNDTPAYICGKFKTGFPVTWQRDICLWVDYQMRNCPSDYFLPYTLNQPLKYLSNVRHAATSSSQREVQACELMPAPSSIPKQKMKFAVYFPHIQGKTIRKNQLAVNTKTYQLATTKHNSVVTSTPIAQTKATSKFTFNEISNKKQHGAHENDNDVDNISNYSNITNISDEALLQITRNPNENSLNCSEILSNSKSNSKLKAIMKNTPPSTNSMTLRSHSRSINNHSSCANCSTSSTRKRKSSTIETTTTTDLTITSAPSSPNTATTSSSSSKNKRAKLSKLSEPTEKPKTQRKRKVLSPIKKVSPKKVTNNNPATDLMDTPLSEFKKPLRPAPKPAKKIFKKVAPKPSAAPADSELSTNTTSSSTITDSSVSSSNSSKSRKGRRKIFSIQSHLQNCTDVVL